MKVSPWILEAVRQAARSVYDELGVGHNEAVYEAALEVELSYGLWNIGPVRRQVTCPISYKGFSIGSGLIDILVDEILVVEVKAVSKLSVKDESQVRKYLVGTGLEKGLLINFGPELEIVDVAMKRKD